MSDAPEGGSVLAFEVLTLFPAAIEGFAAAGLLGKAVQRGLVHVHCTDIREFTRDKHRTVDDAPFGGGAGMVIKPEPVVEALESVEQRRGPAHRILLTPSAPRFDQRVAERLARLDRIALVCGRYEGIDDRVREHFVDECLSLGDFVLGGGEVAALAIIEAVARLREGVLGNPESIVHESFATDDGGQLLECPQYTRPAVFREHAVPQVLQGGNHAAIETWRRQAARRRTWALRPELRKVAPLHGAVELHLAVEADDDARLDAAALASVARRHGVRSIVLLGAGKREVLEFVEATAGRVQVTGLPDLAALARRMRRRVRIVALVAPSAPTQQSRVIREAGELVELLSDATTPVVLWHPRDGEALQASPPPQLCVVFAPHTDAQNGRMALATEPAIADPSRPPSGPGPTWSQGPASPEQGHEQPLAVAPPAASESEHGGGRGTQAFDRALTLLRNPSPPG
jgi:tRNA (guanine-N1)-methyltransferase